MTTKPKSEEKFRQQYDRLFKRNPMAANLMLLLSEIADARGIVKVSDEEITRLMSERFEDPRGYAL